MDSRGWNEMPDVILQRSQEMREDEEAARKNKQLTEEERSAKKGQRRQAV